MTSDNVVIFNGITKMDVPPERILNKAVDADLDAAVVIGWKKDGDFYFASSYADSAQVIYLLRRAEHDLLKMEDELSGEK